MDAPLPAILPAPPIAEEAPLVPLQDEVSIIVDDRVDDEPLQQFTQDPGEILNMIRAQYQEALYISQVRSFCIRLYCVDTDRMRHPWHILQKDHYHEHERASSVMIAQPKGHYFQHF